MDKLVYKKSNLRKLKSKLETKQEGLTILEVLVVMIIIGILITPITRMIIINEQMTTRARDMSNEKDITLSVQQYIVDEMKLADKVTYHNTYPESVTPLGPNHHYIYMSPLGLINQTSLGENIIFSKEYFYPFQIEIHYNVAVAGKVSEIEVIAKKNIRGISEAVYSTKTKVKSINMLGDTIAISNGSIAEYSIPIP